MPKLCDEIYAEARRQLEAEIRVNYPEVELLPRISEQELDRRFVRLLCEKVEILLEEAPFHAGERVCVERVPTTIGTIAWTLPGEVVAVRWDRPGGGQSEPKPVSSRALRRV